MALACADLTAGLREIRNPTLVMAGSLDATTPVHLVRKLATAIDGARFLEIPACGHCPQIEQPQAFVAAVHHFLDG